MATLTGSARTEIDFRQTDVSRTELQTVIDPLLMDLLETFAHGTGANQCNVMWHDRRTLGITEIDTFDLWDRTMIDPSTGYGIQFEIVRLFYVRMVTDNTYPTLLRLYPEAVEGWVGYGPFTDAGNWLNLQDGNIILFVAQHEQGMPVAAHANRFSIKNDWNPGNPANDITYDIVIIGVGTHN